MVFKFIERTAKKAVGTVSKVVSGVAKGVKKAVKTVGNVAEKAVKGVAKGVREVGRGVRKLAKNKYVRLGLMITAAVMLPGAIAALPAISALGTTAAAVATGAITGAITGAGSTLLAGGDLGDALKTGALGAATGAAFARIGQAIKGAQATTPAEATGAFDASKPIDVDLLPTDSSGTLDLDALTTADGSFQVTSPLEISKDLATDAQTVLGELRDLSLPPAARFGQVPSMGEQVAQANVDFDFTDPSVRQLAGLPELPKAPKLEDIKPQQSFGERFKDSIKDTFSPENLVSAGGDLVMGAAEQAIAQRLQGDPETVGAYGERPTTVGPNLLEQFQVAYRNADINIADAYQNMTYGSGDVNAIGNELFRQETIRIV
tara:strand:+ start:851 stop:1978 length:1128 start_codon:yes stop_codon:yes gene_type:complete